MARHSKHDATHRSWWNRLTSVLPSLHAPRSSGAVTLGKTNSHGFIMSALARASVGAMARRIGVKPEELAANPFLHEDVVRDCADCKERARCQEWLSDPDCDPEEYREFCDNAERFQKFGVES